MTSSKERIIFMKWIGDSVHGPEHVDVTFIREDIANARIAAAEQRAKEAELKSVKYLDRVIELEAHGPRTKEGLFCTVCGTPYDSSEQCRSCKNARRIFNFQWGIKERRFGCMHPSCQFPEWIGYSPHDPRTEIPKEDVHADGTFVQKLTFWLQRGNITVDPRDVVIFHKSALPAKKEDEMKP